jgi:hypothetical protein
MRIRPATRRSRRILKTTVAACALSAAAAGTLFAAGAGAVPVPPKYVMVYVPAGVRCFSVQVSNIDASIVFGNGSKPHAGPGGTRRFAYRHFDVAANNRAGGGWYGGVGMTADVGSTVEVVTNRVGCGHLAVAGPNHITDWKVTADSNDNVWVDTHRVEGP